MSEHQPVFDCSACLREGKEKNAKLYCYDCEENMCEDCHTYHKKNKSSLDHTVSEIEAKLIKTDDVYLLKQLTKCVIHRKESIKYVCKNHDVVCCNECVIVGHRKCNRLVSVIEECTSVSTASGTDNDRRLEDLEQSVNILSEQGLTKLEAVSKAKSQVKKELEYFKSKIDKAYQALEQKVIKETDETCEEILKACSSTAEEVKDTKNELLTLKQTTRAFGKTDKGQPQHAYLFERKLRKEIHDLKEKIQILNERSVMCEIKLVENKTLDDLLESISTCLEVKNISQLHNSNRSSMYKLLSENCQDFRQRKLILENERDYGSYGCPRYSAWVGKYILVALQDQNELVQFDAEKLAFVSAYRCNSNPSSMTTVDDTTVAVSLPEVENIIIIGITNTHLELKETIQAGAAFHAISFNKSLGQFVSLSQTNCAIDFLGRDGKKEHSVHLNESVKSKIQSAHGIAFDKDMEIMYVSCTDWDMVLALHRNGQVLGELVNGNNVSLIGPLDIDLDIESNVYVFCRGGRSIIQCDKDLNFLREISHAESNLEYAYSMSFNKDMTKFVISEQHGLGSVYLKVYSFK